MLFGLVTLVRAEDHAPGFVPCDLARLDEHYLGSQWAWHCQEVQLFCAADRFLADLAVAPVGVEAVHHAPRFDHRELVHPKNHFLGRHSGRGTSLIGAPVDDEN